MLQGSGRELQLDWQQVLRVLFGTSDAKPEPFLVSWTLLVPTQIPFTGEFICPPASVSAGGQQLSCTLLLEMALF